MDFIRSAMYESIQKALTTKSLYPLKGRVLAISGLGNFRTMLAPDATLTETSWPEVNMLALPYEDEAFDIVISDQILEHIEGSPEQAVSESLRVLKPGGIAIHTTVFMYRIHHKHPSDFWRFSLYGLRHLFRTSSEIIVCDGWGNRLSQILLIAFPRLASADVTRFPGSLLSPLLKRKAANFYHTVWIVAQK